MTDPRFPGYNNPAIGAAFSDLAKIFAPPSAQEMYAGAKAAETRQKMQGIADLYRMAQDPNFNREAFDRLGIAAGSWNPNQSFYATDQADATKRFGIGVESGDRRYSTDVGAATARRGQDIHSGDVRRGQDINSADDRYKTDVNAGVETNKLLSAPLSTGQTRIIPPTLATIYGVPSQQTGIVELKPGEKSILPNGRTLEGNPKPLTETEVKAQAFAKLSPREQEAAVFGNTPLETDAKTGQPLTRPQALAGGTPVVDKSHQPQLFNYQTADKKTGAATMLNGVPVDAMTKQPLPPGTQLQSPSGVQSKEPLGATTANQTAANAQAAKLSVLSQAIDSYEKLLRENPGIIGIPGAVRGAAQNAVSVAQEFGAAFGNMAPEAKVGADMVQEFGRKFAANRDPAIAAAHMSKLDLAYKYAQMQNPTGEVSRQALERALETIDGGALQNNQSALEALAALRQQVEREFSGVNTLRNPAPVVMQTPGPRTIQTPKGNVTIEPVQP